MIKMAPKAQTMYKLWVGMVGVSPLPAAPKLCSLHFTSHQYKRTGIGPSSLHTPMNEDHRKPKKLKKNAFPSLFYDSDGELFEMVPVTVPECSDEDPDEEATLNSVLGDLQSVYSEDQRNIEKFSTASNKAETEKHCAYHPHCNGAAQSGGQGHASMANHTDKTAGKKLRRRLFFAARSQQKRGIPANP
ncbi:hypothetical protein AAFF_G00126730 [Aldrovandia affinis]|uniref:THAP-type domain-containing protein n=1 Tax=Aldrovandia affinis TaxID=143900 RepID=A0AAD7W9J4_9TELE|nr:hypothetical protein AAFF_G00126730 [Aldrovandia affinis]